VTSTLITFGNSLSGEHRTMPGQMGLNFSAADNPDGRVGNPVEEEAVLQ
jgi:hypothetical protein